MDYLEKIYIAGDGAAWIKAGCEVLEKAHFVLDKFHMDKYIISGSGRKPKIFDEQLERDNDL